MCLTAGSPAGGSVLRGHGTFAARMLLEEVGHFLEAREGAD